MSSPNDKKPSNDETNDANICRDFLNNICNRGSKCRFNHPPTERPKEEYKFCLDFQNHGCMRENCRYVHASVEDAERYKRLGDISLSLARAIAIATQSDTINGIPICKEFLKSTCERGSRCRFWHVDPRGEDPRYASGIRMPHSSRLQPPALHSGRSEDGFERYAKRFLGGAFAPPMVGSSSRFEPAFVPPPTERIAELERRNAELTIEVESLKRELEREKERYSDLMMLFRESTAATAVAAAVQRQKQQQPLPGMLPAVSGWPVASGVASGGVSSPGGANVPSRGHRRSRSPLGRRPYNGGAW